PVRLPPRTSEQTHDHRVRDRQLHPRANDQIRDNDHDGLCRIAWVSLATNSSAGNSASSWAFLFTAARCALMATYSASAATALAALPLDLRHGHFTAPAQPARATRRGS